MTGATMRAAIVREHGGPEAAQVEEIPAPEVGAGQVSVRVRAAAMNHLDVWVRRGLPGAPFHLPIIGGSDVAGDVLALGDGVDGPAVGTPVMVLPGVSCWSCEACDSGRDHQCRSYGILGESRDGGFAEQLVVPAKNVIPKPEGLTYEDAAALSLSMLMGMSCASS